MIRFTLPRCLCCTLFLSAAPHGFGEIVSSATEQSDIGPLADMHDKFEKMEHPLLEMGDSGNRVRELQATLNMNDNLVTPAPALDLTAECHTRADKITVEVEPRLAP